MRTNKLDVVQRHGRDHDGKVPSFGPDSSMIGENEKMTPEQSEIALLKRRVSELEMRFASMTRRWTRKETNSPAKELEDA
jgi:hypothetical protein